MRHFQLRTGQVKESASRCGGGWCSIPRMHFYSSENLLAITSCLNCVFFVSLGPNIHFGYILLQWHLNMEETRRPCTCWPFAHGGRRTCDEVSVSLTGVTCSFAESTQKTFFWENCYKILKRSVETFNGKK